MRAGIRVQTKASRISIEEMSLDELMQFRDRADRLIGERLLSEKSSLREKLAAIERYERNLTGVTSSGRLGGPIRRAAPKYRDPVSGATWAGRGQMPRWMTKHIAQGARPEDFLISDRNRY